MVDYRSGHAKEIAILRFLYEDERLVNAVMVSLMEPILRFEVHSDVVRFIMVKISICSCNFEGLYIMNVIFLFTVPVNGSRFTVYFTYSGDTVVDLLLLLINLLLRWEHNR